MSEEFIRAALHIIAYLIIVPVGFAYFYGVMYVVSQLISLIT